MTLRKEEVLALERGLTSSGSVENWPWKRLWTGRKTE
jgi:hypothetical protein